jgi:fructose-1,6-bisphosphatase I
MSTTGITLHQYSLAQQQQNAYMVEELPQLLAALSCAAQTVAREIRRAALVGQLGWVGGSNPTGDAQKKLDVLGNTTVMEALAETGLVAAVVSEELPEATPVSRGRAAKYIVCVDPLDGSSNTDINGPVGTIFGIRRCGAAGQSAMAADVLRRGSEQVAAGYVMYGPGTVFVYTCGTGVNGFTWDDERGEFVLTHPDLRCPWQGHYYSANLGHYHEWHPHLQRFIDYLTQHDPLTHRPYSLRYTGALVADVHRSLLEGGLYFYPADAEHQRGKLRLLYECAPLAFVVEQAGGRASSGTARMLDIQADTIHQRVPLVIGSAQDVALYEQFLATGRPA